MEMLLTNHDLASALQGSAIMCRLSDDRDALLRLAGGPLDRDSLAEKRALEMSLPIVAITRDDAVTAARGQTALVEARDGHGALLRVLVRLMTADELIAAHERACREIGQEPNLSREKAEQLTARLP